MKKNLFIIIALMATSLSYAQSIRVYNWDFKNGSEAEVGKIFEQYFRSRKKFWICHITKSKVFR